MGMRNLNTVQSEIFMMEEHIKQMTRKIVHFARLFCGASSFDLADVQKLLVEWLLSLRRCKTIHAEMIRGLP